MIVKQRSTRPLVRFSLGFTFPILHIILQDMKAHTQCEFEASIRQGAIEASSRQTSGWLAASCNVREHADKTLEVSFFVSGTPDESKAVIGHDFEVEPWSRHAIQFEGNSVPTLVLVCKTGHTKNNAILKIPSARGLGGGVPPSWLESSQTRVRSLGYVGSFLREYCSAAELLSGMRHSTLLGVVAAPAKLRSSPAGGTFLWADDRSLDTASVPLNATQRNAVLNLTGGLDIIVGPPGMSNVQTWLEHQETVLPVDWPSRLCRRFVRYRALCVWSCSQLSCVSPSCCPLLDVPCLPAIIVFPPSALIFDVLRDSPMRRIPFLPELQQIYSSTVCR